MLGNRINEMVHGILVGHVYYYLVEIVPTITGKRVLTTPRILVELLLGGDGDDDDDGGAQEEEDDDQHYQPQAHVGVVPLHERRFGREVATTAHIAAKVGNLDQLYLLSRSAQGRATFGAKDTNGWQPLHEAVRGMYV